MRSGRIADGMRALEAVLASIGMSMPTTPWLVLLSLLFHEVLLRVRGIRFRTRDASELSATTLTRIDIVWSVGALLSMVHPIPAKVFQKKHLLLALRAGEARRVARGMAVEAATGSFPGAPAHARNERRLRATQELAKRLDDPYSIAWALGAEGSSAYFEGRFRTALECCDRSVTVLRDRCNGAQWEIATSSTIASWALFQLGELQELGRRVTALTQEARDRGDNYMLTNARIGSSNAVWLAADDPDGAERDLADAMAQWGTDEQRVQQYHDLFARVHIQLYRGRAREALALIDARWRSLAKAHLLRIQLVRVIMHQLRARAALALSATSELGGATSIALAKAALRDARSILRERLPWATPLARLVEATVCSRRGERDQAIGLLDEAARDLAARDMILWSAAGTRRRGELVGGEQGHALVAEADTTMRGQGVKQPAKYAAMLMPGFPETEKSSETPSSN